MIIEVILKILGILIFVFIGVLEVFVVIYFLISCIDEIKKKLRKWFDGRSF